MTRMLYDPNQPSKAMSLANLRNTLGGLHQMDLAPLRVRASRVLDDMEYASNALAQGVWSGTGVTVSSSGTAQEGSYSVQAVIDGTGNRILTRNAVLDLDAFESVKLWHRATSASATFKFFIEDSAGNISYWNVTTSGSSNTWVQETIALASPDSNNGSDADLSGITDWGFSSLQASKTYLFDTSKAICGMNVAVGATDVGAFYRNVYLENQPIETDSQTSPTITAPSSNPRIDILTINSSGTLAWVVGSENSTPTPNWAGLANNVMPIALVYMKTTMTKVVDYEDKDGNPNEGYILADIRPFLNLGSRDVDTLTDEDGDTKVQVEESADEDKIRFDVAGTEKMVLDANGLEVKDGVKIADGTQGDGKVFTSDANGNGTWQSPPVQVASLQGTISNGGTIPLPSGYTQGQCTWMVSLRTVNINNDQHATQMHTYVVKADVSANRVVTLSDTGNVSNLTANYIIIGIK